ncbi:MAG: hypothetical protein AAF721_22975 [Myxococcota bacterium]
MRGWLVGLAVACAPGCTFGGDAASVAVDGDGSDAAGDGADPTGVTDGVPPGDGAPMTGDSTSGTVGDPSGDGSTSDAASSSEGSSSGGDVPAIGCPADLPEGWIFCEDFDDAIDPTAGFDWFAPIETFAVSDEWTHSGDGAIRIHHEVGDDNAGSARIRFGDSGAGKGAVIHQPDAVFDEVWVRYWFATDSAWPGGGHGDTIGLEALLDSESRVSHVLIQNPLGQDVPRLFVSTCFSSACDGNSDWQDDDEVHSQLGTTPINAADGGGEWHCGLLHGRLNGDDQDNALIEFEIDGVEQTAHGGFEWRNTAVGFNHLRVSGWATGNGLASERTRYLDDIAIAAVPLACPRR